MNTHVRGCRRFQPHPAGAVLAHGRVLERDIIHLTRSIMRNRSYLVSIAVLLASLVAGCSDNPVDPEPDALPEEELVFLRFAAAAPAPADSVVSFWAVRGEDREVEIRLAPEEGEEEGEEFLEFEVSGGSLLRRPDGSAFQRGDSVLITIRLVDASRFMFEFEPSGLKFDPDHPAELEVSYARADPDFDGDGQDDEELRFGFWRQEREGELWFRMGTVFIEDLSEVEADIEGFTRYALASG